MNDKKIVAVILGGVLELHTNIEDVDIMIYDFDNIKEGGDVEVGTGLDFSLHEGLINKLDEEVLECQSRDF